VKRLVLTDLPPDLDSPDRVERMTAEIGEIYDGEVIWGRHLMELTIGD
jgi:hypothetical protein